MESKRVSILGHHQFTASGLVLTADRKILLVEHAKLGVWLYPGGHVELDETPDEATCREILEETGLKVKIIGSTNDALSNAGLDVKVLHTPYLVWRQRIPEGDRYHFHTDLVYVCCLSVPDAKSEIVPQPSEIDAARFFTQAEIDDVATFDNFRELLRWAFEDGALWVQVDEHYRLLDSIEG